MNALDDVNIGLANFWKVTCLDKDGNVKWEENKKNIIVTAGLNHILDTQFHATTQNTTWYIGLKGAGTPVADLLFTPIMARVLKCIDTRLVAAGLFIRIGCARPRFV